MNLPCLHRTLSDRGQLAPEQDCDSGLAQLSEMITIESGEAFLGIGDGSEIIAAVCSLPLGFLGLRRMDGTALGVTGRRSTAAFLLLSAGFCSCFPKTGLPGLHLALVE